MANIFKRKLTIVVLLILVGGLVIFLVVKGLKAPAQGSLSQTPPSKAEKTVAFSQPGTYKGKYVSFTYPAHYKPAPTKLTGTYLELASYSSTDQTFKEINVGVYSGTISNDSGVSLRRLNKNSYKETTSARGVEFTKADGSEDTFFLEHNGLMASVSTTGPDAVSSGETLYIASSLHWR
jgi:hypothetical protein